MKFNKKQLRYMIRREASRFLDEAGRGRERVYGEDYLSKTHPDGDEELADPELDFVDESRGRRIHEVEYAMDDDPVGRFTLELENAWDGALMQDAMESELAMAVEMFLEDRGFS